MERVAILVLGDRVGAEDLTFLTAAPRPASGGPPAGPFDLVTELERVERDLVLAVLERCRWKMAKAAAELNLERSHLYKKLKSSASSARPKTDPSFTSRGRRDTACVPSDTLRPAARFSTS